MKKRGRPSKLIKGVYVDTCPVWRFDGSPINKGCCEVLRSVPKFRAQCGGCGGIK